MGKLARGLKVTADALIVNCTNEDWDAIVLPGGTVGAETLRDNKVLTELLKKHVSEGKLTAAVCASPAVVLQHHGLLKGSATCYPAQQHMEEIADWKDEKVVVNGNIITGQGAGCSMQFALKVVEALYGEEKADEIAWEL